MYQPSDFGRADIAMGDDKPCAAVAWQETRATGFNTRGSKWSRSSYTDSTIAENRAGVQGVS
jgi:hypothetical protein